MNSVCSSLLLNVRYASAGRQIPTEFAAHEPRQAEAYRTFRRRELCFTALLLIFVLLAQTTMPVRACGPETIDPIFVFSYSPDLPFEEFAKGKLGILQSTFGRKTLVIAHRYLEGGTFTEDEQRSLVEALKGKAPEDDDNTAVKVWIAARKEVLQDEKEPPAIYDERRDDGYDFFPNCTKNAFEVATQTLKDRVSSYGAEDVNVRDWLQAQDIVFRNCAEGSLSPSETGAGSPRWLQKDRQYQIAAAFFYSLNFTEARSRFEGIAEDADSMWQETASYLVGRTLVRQGSLTKNENEKRALYEQAEAYLINHVSRGGRFQNAAKRLLGLVKYRLHPDERVRELAQILDEQSGNENLRQDLIDYTWLLDKFDEQVQKEEEERKKQLNPTPSPEPNYKPDPKYQERYQAIQHGELIEVYFSPIKPDGQADYEKSVSLELKADATEVDAFHEVEVRLGRKLSPEEAKDLKDAYASAVSRRLWLMSPNRKMVTGDYDGCGDNCNQLPLKSFPAFLRADDLSDWIMTFESTDRKAYAHALFKWRQNHSTAWLSVALSKANRSSPSLGRLLREAERVDPSAPAFPTVAYHLVRLRLELNESEAAKQLLDQIISTQLEALPISSQNLFLEQRMNLADNVGDFLRFSGRKPVAFYEYVSMGRISDILRIEKGFWDPDYTKETKEEYDRKKEESFKELLLWDDRKAFDENTVDVLNWHFPLPVLLEVSRDQALPDYLRRSVALAVWTRAVLVKNGSVAMEAARDLARIVPEMSAMLSAYLDAKTPEQRDHEALYIMLKFSNLSPWVPSGVPVFLSAEESEYYFELSWWCKPDDIEYDINGTESPKIVASPRFLSAQALSAAKRERAAIKTIGNAKAFLGKKVLEWAKRSPNDPRIPEALYIAVQANQSYKYGCDSWEQDEETRLKLEGLLREKYPESSWTAKLDPDQ